MKFRIYTAEHLPPHCHVSSQDGQAKFEIKDEVTLIENRGLKPKDISLAYEDSQIMIRVQIFSKRAGEIFLDSTINNRQATRLIIVGQND